MTTITRKNQLEYLFSDDEIPLDIFGVKIPAEDYQRLRMGESSSLLENVITDDRASVRDAKIILTRERDGKVKVNLSFKKPVLEIPDKILDHQLNELQKQDLSAGKTVGPLSYNSQELYLKVDPELNRIVVSCGRELSVPAEIGGYKLSAAEKNDLANGRQLKNKVLKGEYGFFLAKISITDDKKGLVFSDVKELSPLEANRLLADLNRDERVFEKGSVVDNAAIITRDSQPLEHRETLVKKQQESQHNLDREFTTAYEKKNYKELVNLHARGYVPG